MQRIVDFIIRFKEYLTLSLLIIISFLLMSLGNAAELYGFRTVVVGGIGVAQSLFSWIPNPVALQSENKALRNLNYSLSREVARTRKALIENDHLRAMLDLKKQTTSPLIMAEVVGKIVAEMRGYVTLNKGEKDGIQAGLSVQTDRGLVGHVLATSDNFSLVQLILNRDTRIAVQVERTRIDGIVAWEGGEHLVLKNIAKTQDIQAGDMVLTSGFSSVFPSAVYIGRVSEVQDEPNSLFRRVLLTPTVDFSTLEQVFVSTKKPSPERQELEQIVAKKLQSKK